ncbi:MAG TPA: hypothetical protein VMU64_13200 [Acidimicrobiales bacterium]|nr:hypothetical protein [Acidimicrobiales bacterium]
MRHSADIWPQALWATARYDDEVWVPDSGATPGRSVAIVFGLVAAAIGTIVFLALVVAPSAGAAGGCGGG